MSYSSIASNIRSYCSTISTACKGINSNELDSIWSGSAHDTLTNNLATAVSNMESEISQLKEYASALEKVDKYKEVLKDIETLNSDIQSWRNNSDPNVDYSSQIRSAESKLESKNETKKELKSDINSVLNGLSSFSKQFEVIEAEDATDVSGLAFDVEALLAKFKSGSLVKMGEGDSLYNYYDSNEVEQYLSNIKEQYTGRDAAVNCALAMIDLAADVGGKLDYDWGGGHNESYTSTSSVAAGADCSAFASWAVNQGSASPFATMTTSGLINQGTNIDYSSAQAGDLLVKDNNGNGHVVLVIKNDPATQTVIVAEANSSAVGTILNTKSYSDLAGQSYLARDMSSIYGEA